MKVTFVLPPASLGGGTRVVAIYAQALAAKGHQVVLVSVPYPKKRLLTKIKSLLKGGAWTKDIVPPSHLDGLGLDHRVLSHRGPVSDQDVPDADVIIATWWETAEWVYALSPEKGVKVYFIQHHEVFDILPVERCKATYRLPMHKIVIAKWLKEVMQRDYGDADVDLVHNSVDKKQFFAPPRDKQSRPTVGFLFAYADFKGVDITLQALAKLKKKIPELRIICFGTKPPIGVTHWDPSIEFFHSPAQDKIKDIYAQCDVWMTASRSEGFNLPAMEAMACRTPVVSTDTGWPSEAVKSYQNGMLVPINDIDAMANGTDWILGLDNERWKELSQSAYQTVATSSWEAAAELFEDSLLRAIEKKKALQSYAS